VLADPESEEDPAAAAAASQRPRQAQVVKKGSPEAKHGRLRPRQVGDEQDVVNRQPDGSYLLGLLGDGQGRVPSVMTLELRAEEEQKSRLGTCYRSLLRSC